MIGLYVYIIQISSLYCRYMVVFTVSYSCVYQTRE